jgi:hypothetical protein
MVALKRAPDTHETYVSRNDKPAAGPPKGVNKNLMVEKPKNVRYRCQCIVS